MAEGQGSSVAHSGHDGPGPVSKKAKKERHFEQREIITKNKNKGEVDAKLGSVLSSLF